MKCVVCSQPALVRGSHGREEPQLPYCSEHCYRQACVASPSAHAQRQRQQATKHRKDRQQQRLGELIQEAIHRIQQLADQQILDVVSGWDVVSSVELSVPFEPEHKPELCGLRSTVPNTDLHRYFICQRVDDLLHLADRELRKRLLLHNSQLSALKLYGTERWQAYCTSLRSLWNRLSTIPVAQQKRLQQRLYISRQQEQHLIRHLCQVMDTTNPLNMPLSLRFSRILVDPEVGSGRDALQRYLQQYIAPAGYNPDIQLPGSLLEIAEQSFREDPWCNGAGNGVAVFYKNYCDNGLQPRAITMQKQEWIEEEMRNLVAGEHYCAQTPLAGWMRQELDRYWERAVLDSLR
jgi:hypothetical protein